MAIFRTFSQIVSSMVDRLRLTQPNLDTKPGTVARDLFIDIQADEIEQLHRSLALIAEKQSPELASGKDLDRWANNFGIIRRVGSPSNGLVVFTTNDISTDIPIPSGTIVTARNGVTFSTIGTFVMSSAEKNKFAANANRLRGALNLAGITDSYAIEVPVRATRSGTSGNIATLQIIENNLENVLNVTNLTTFNGGTNLESDQAFRSRIFAVFSGANTGTASGYTNAALSVPGVSDVIVVEPGNTLMLRDGTETIEVRDGSFRIIDSGTGGKVDMYILGTQLTEIVESYVFNDISGSGDATDERNDIILGQQNQDSTLTSEERRVNAFSTGVLPLQPVNSIVSVIGSSSGILAEKTTDESGNVSGNFELIKDTNVSTGGSPFGFDKIRFVSNYKDVEFEGIVKQGLNTIDPLRFTDINELELVYEDIQVTNENSNVSSADRKFIRLNHSPVVNVSRVTNRTSGETYVIESQNLDTETGLNTDGIIEISGKTLPTTADVLSVDYTWRLIYDKYIDYNGSVSPALFSDDSVADSIDWGPPNGIFLETSTIGRTDDGFEYQVQVSNQISRVISVFSGVSTDSTVSTVVTSEDVEVPGVVVPNDQPAIMNIVSIKNEEGVELFDTNGADGTFSGRTVFLPSDTSAIIGENVTVLYNKVELFDIENTDGSFSNDIISLPSEDILAGNDLLDDVESIFLVDDEIYTKYVAAIENIVPSQELTSLPISGSTITNNLLDSGLVVINNAKQPVEYTFDEDSVKTSIDRFGPTRLAVSLTGIVRAGKIKVTGTSLTRLELEITAGTSINELAFDLDADMRSALGLSQIPASIGIARLDKIQVVDTEEEYDLTGYKLLDNSFALGTAGADTTLSSTEFTLPSTDKNNSISLTSGSKVNVTLLYSVASDYEDLFFATDGLTISDKVFGRIDRIAVSSGLRNSAGALVGTILVTPNNQPRTGSSYFTNYNFVAPKEGERITVRYNLNRLISDVTVGVENVRPITADVLVKESFSLPVDVSGEILVNSNAESSSDTILEDVTNAVTNLLNTSTLGSIIDYSDVISVATAVNGVDSINISLFNETGEVGRRSFIKALDNQHITAGIVTFEAVSRQNFRIT